MTLPPRIMSRRDIERHLKPGIARRCFKAGWLTPKNRVGRTHIYDRADVLAVEERILNGEKP